MSIASILFIFLLAIGMFYSFMNWGKENRIIESWPKTTGKILKKDILGQQLVISYEYYVNGVRYESSKVYRYLSYYEVGIKWGKLDDINELEFIKNPEVKYNPENPTDCCLLLYYEKLWLKIVVLIAGIVFTLIGLLGILVRTTKV